MKLLGREIPILGGSSIKKDFEDLKLKFDHQQEQLKHAAVIADSMRPAMDYMNNFSAGGIQYQRYPYSLNDIYETFFLSDTLFTCANARTKAVFRNGYETAPVFVRKCPECLTEFQADNEECTECGAKTREPDETQRKQINILFNAFTDKVNANGQNIQVVQELNDTDLNAVDDMFLLTLFEYEFSGSKISNMTPREIVRGDPRVMKLIADRSGRPGFGDDGKPIYACVIHRFQPQKTEKCQCGKDNFIAYHVAMNSYAGGKDIYYFDWEVIHESKFHPSLTYGTPNPFKVWRKVHALMAMDKFIMDYYTKERMPRSGVIFDTNNIPDLKAQIQEARDKQKQNSAEPLYLGVKRDAGSGPVATVIELMKPLDEMQYIDSREEMRRTIGAAYGVMPMFQGDLSASGGLNNEGLQITVTNQVIETDQILHNRVLKKLVKNFGITDFTIKLKPHEESDEMAEIQIEIARADHAMRMQQLGFNVKYTPEKNFEFEGADDGESHKDVEEMYEQQMQAQNAATEQTPDKKMAARNSGAPVAKSLDLYTEALNKYGDTAKGVGWRDTSVQTKRYDVFLNVIKGEKYPQVLDAGSGTGHLYTYMTRKGIFPRYKGIDANYKCVGIALSKGIRVEKAFISDVQDNYDYIYSGGVHNLQGASDPRVDMKTLYEKCNKALVINMLKKSEGTALRAFDKHEMFAIAKTLTPHVDLVEGYLENDFTLILRKGYTPKPTKQQLSEAEQIEDELTKELKKVLNELKFRKDMSIDEVRAMIRVVSEKISHKLKKTAEAEVKGIYTKAMKHVGQEMNIEFAFTQRDEHAVNLLKNNQIFTQAFENVEKDVAKKLNIIIASAYRRPEDFTLDKIVGRMKNVSDESEGHLTNIARTETNHISNLARENSYSQIEGSEGLLFRWIGPSDDRTTDVCKAITRRTENGVTMAQMKAIIAEESAKTGFTARDYTPHYSCRHTFIRVM